MDLHSLVSLLADGKFHSGSELGQKLGVSRTAIWKALGQLDSLGLNVESVKGKGYQLASPLDLLDEQKIQTALPSSIQSRTSVALHLSLDSTNASLIKTPEFGADHYAVVLAEQQTAGRGRRGRSWVSPFARNIYLSIGFDLQGGVEALSGLSLVIGLATIRALKQQGFDQAKLKWPNDVWVADKKLAGILVELQGEPTSAWKVVAGVGLNVAMTEEQGVAIDQPWTALNQYIRCSRNALAAAMVQNLVEVLDVFGQHGLPYFLDEWNQADLLCGQYVGSVGDDAAGIARGIDQHGALLLETDDGLVAINAGEVSVRPLPN